MNCKQGDLAIVISGPCTGVMCEVLEWVGYHKCPSGAEANDAWRVKSLSAFRFIYNGVRSEYGYGRDSQLRPIRGEPETIDERQEVEA